MERLFGQTSLRAVSVAPLPWMPGLSMNFPSSSSYAGCCLWVARAALAAKGALAAKAAVAAKAAQAATASPVARTPGAPSQYQSNPPISLENIMSIFVREQFRESLMAIFFHDSLFSCSFFLGFNWRLEGERRQGDATRSSTSRIVCVEGTGSD